MEMDTHAQTAEFVCYYCGVQKWSNPFCSIKLHVFTPCSGAQMHCAAENGQPTME